MEMAVLIENAEPMAGDLPPSQKKMVLAWAVLRRDELMDDWRLAESKQALFPIDPIR